MKNHDLEDALRYSLIIDDWAIRMSPGDIAEAKAGALSELAIGTFCLFREKYQSAREEDKWGIRYGEVSKEIVDKIREYSKYFIHVLEGYKGRPRYEEYVHKAALKLDRLTVEEWEVPKLDIGSEVTLEGKKGIIIDASTEKFRVRWDDKTENWVTQKDSEIVILY